MTTASELWQQHTFHILLADLFKARKDIEMGPMRLQVLMDYVLAQGPALPKPAAVTPGPIHRTVAAELADHPLTADEKPELLALRQDNMPDSLGRLAEVGEIIKTSIAQDGWRPDGTQTILVKRSRNFDHNFLKSWLNQNGCPCSDASIALAPGKFGDVEGGGGFWSITLRH